jgi:TolB-like protein/DNA-binding winged helix-turn-helix (wHTH) protein/Tfp pilus assembly protein PilF
LPNSNTTHQFGDFEIQPDFNTITRDDVISQLSPRVMDVLMHLIENSHRIVPADELLETFWTDRVVEESTIHRHISQVRAALGDSAKEAKYIKTVSKRGYQAVATIKIFSAPVVVKNEAEEPLLRGSVSQSNQTHAESEITPEPYVFISYSHKDGDVVYKEIDWLENQGVKVWSDKGIIPGSNWLAAIGDSILGASTVLFFVSARSLASEHCNREISLALDESINIIPIYLDETQLTSDLKVGLSRVQALRLKEQGFRTQLLQTLTFTKNDKVQVSPVVPIKPKRPHMSITAAVIALILVVTSVVWFQVFTSDSMTNAGINEADEPSESIAVLPFTNLSERDSVGFFAKGLSDSVLDELASIGHIKVASRTAAFQLAEEGVVLGGIADRLSVDYVLEGSVQEQDGELRITTQLIRASDGFHVLSKTYQYPFKDSFMAQRQIGKNISQMSHDKIWLDLRQQFPEQFEQLKGIKPEAVSLYLESADYYNAYLLGEGGDLTIMMQLIDRAVEVDPTFTAALSELAWNYTFRIYPGLSPTKSSEKAHAAIQKILALSDDPADAFTLLQTYIRLDLDYASAEKMLEQAIAQVPKQQWLRTILSTIAIREGRWKEGLDLIRADATLHPDQTEAEFLPIYTKRLLQAGRYQESLKISEQALDLIHQGPPKATVLLTKVDALLRMDRADEAEPLLDEAWYATQGRNTEQFAQFFVRMGQVERGRTVLESATVTAVNRLHFAQGYERLGDINTVFDLIHDGILDHDPSILEVMRSNIWSEAVRQDRRFRDMLDLLESKEIHTPRYLRDHDGSSVKS